MKKGGLAVRRPSLLVPYLTLPFLMAVLPVSAGAQDWSPFSDVPSARTARKRPPAAESPRPYLEPMGSPTAAGPAGDAPPPGDYLPPPWEARGTAEPARTAPVGPAAPVGRAGAGIERGELAPIPGTQSAGPAPISGGFSQAGGGPALPADVWRGIDMARLEAMLGRLEIPPRSPALHALWRRLLTAVAAPPDGAASGAAFEQVRIETLLKSGLVSEVAEALGRDPDARRDPATALQLARSELASGRREQACALAFGLSRERDGASKAVRAETLLFTGYCAAAQGNKPGAGLAADMAREEGIDVPGLALLDAVSAGSKLKHTAAGPTTTLIELKLMEMAGALDRAKVVTQAKPAILAALAADKATEPLLRVAAAESAAKLNAITPEALAEVYRATPQNRADTPSTRAELFRTAESEVNPQRKARLIRGFLDEARRAGLYLPGLLMCAKPSEAIVAVPEIGWYAETAVEIALAANDFAGARKWIAFGQSLDQPGGKQNEIGGWLALADIADPSLGRERGKSLVIIEQLAQKGRFAPELLHRLATVLDALDTQVPIPLWEAASRTPQPSGGHLPATGVLTELQDAAKKKEIGRTVLLAMDALGPSGAEGAHMISLGDAIRALKRAGLEGDARRLGFEALLAQWPRAPAS